jgi:Helix-turn-helix domain
MRSIHGFFSGRRPPRSSPSRRLTQEQVGRLVDPPIHHTLISRYENGLSVPPWTLVQLARVLHLELVPTNPVTNEAQHV